MRLPEPAEIIRVGPLPVCRKLLRPPHILVVVLNVITQPLREITFAIVNPIVVHIAGTGGEKLPITGVLAVHH